MASQVGGGDGQIEISIVGNTVRLTQLGAGAGLQLVVHCPTVANLIRYLSNVASHPPPAGSAEIRFAEEGGEMSPQFEPFLPVSRPLSGVGLRGAQRVGSSAQFPSSSSSPSSGGLASLCGSYNQH